MEDYREFFKRMSDEEVKKLLDEMNMVYKSPVEPRVSKHFDMEISFKELIEYNKTCKIDLNSTHHFETYEGVLLYLSYPGHKEKFTIQLGICEDGFNYEGDYGCQDSFKEIPIEQGLKILESYGRLLDTRFDFQYLLLENDLEPNVVQVSIK